MASTSSDDQFKVLEKKIDEQHQRLEDLMKMILEMQNPNSGSIPQIPLTNSQTTGNSLARPLGYTPKLEFPKFDGSNSKNWVKKCEKYFSICKIPDDQKVDLASLYMIDKAEVWVSDYVIGRRNVVWSEFIMDLDARFRDELGDNVVEQFNKLQQSESLESYIDEFESLKSVMFQQNHRLPTSYVLDSFVGELKPAVKPFVKAFNPTSITEASHIYN